MRFSFIEQHVATYPVRVMCRVLGVSASGYHGWRGRLPSTRMIANVTLLGDVRRIQTEHWGVTVRPECMPPFGQRVAVAVVSSSRG